MNANIPQLLKLDQLDDNLFRSQFHRENFRKTLFGGQVLCQALAAASATVENLLPHSLHAYFLRPGSTDSPVIYDVDIVRNGRSISSRRVVARQFGKAILNMSTSFQVEEKGFEHAVSPPEVPSPEELLSRRQSTSSDCHIPSITHAPDQPTSPFSFLPVKENLFGEKKKEAAEAQFWIKVNDSLSADPLEHLCALAFGSDLGLLATSLLPHEATLFDPDLFAASVDHAMWFHSRDFKADDWLLSCITSPWAGNSRGFSIAHMYNRSGKLIASSTQEGLIRRVI